jgi:hypothetical protein
MVQGCALQNLIDVMHTRDTADRQTSNSNGDEGLARTPLASARERRGKQRALHPAPLPRRIHCGRVVLYHLPSRAGRLSQGR